MSEQHTPGKLKVAEGTDRWSAVYDGYGSSATRGLAIEGGHIIALAVEHNANLFSDPDPMENARRLVACWNACDGISTENLEDNQPVKELAEKYNAAFAQRDELLAALKHIEGVALADEWRDLPEIAKHARAAIAKAEGGGV